MAAGGASLRQLVEERRILVCCGSGGVGKTTAAAVLALEAARAGRRAVVVTIDPAKRLADALGLEGLTGTPSRIEGDWPGELWALMLDTKSTFDDLVVANAATPEQGERILANRFYRNISGALSGTQEYMAMEKLYELHQRSDFDLVVVDTPPTRNALDFIDAPRRLSRFLDHRLFRMITSPGRGIVRAVNVAAQAFLRTVAKVVGAEVIDDAVAFFQAFEGMEQGFKDRADAVLQLLSDDDTAFVLVASPRRDTIEEAQYFAEKLGGGGHHRALADREPHAPDLRRRAGRGRWRERAATLEGTDLGGLYRNLADFQLVASREEEHLAGLAEAVAPAPVVRVPFLSTDVHDVAGLTEPRRATCSRLGGLGVLQGGGGVVDRLGDRHDAVEAGGVEQAGEGGAAAGDRDVATGLASATDAADQRAEPGRVHERDRGEVDQQELLGGQAPEGLAELAHRVGVELTYRSAQRVVGGVLHLDVEHTSSKGRWFGVPQG